MTKTTDGYKFRTKLHELLSELCPNYVEDTDNDGQVIIYTGKLYDSVSDIYEDMD